MNYELEELIPITAWLADKYTARESSSITYEKAEQLMQAVQYTINELRFAGTEYGVLTELSARRAYDIGYEILCRRVRECQALYNSMIPDFDAFGNVFCRDTVVKGLPRFFLYYDVRFNPQDHLLTLDYITRDFDIRLTGIDQIAVYLDSIAAEQRYLRKFPREQVIQTLFKWNRDYCGLPVNIAEIMQNEGAGDGTGDETDGTGERTDGTGEGTDGTGEGTGTELDRTHQC